MTPLISVILPTFNRATFIRRAVDSIFAQTFRDFELIVVDDGSTDNTLEILAQFGDRLRIIRQQNGGVAAARNTGIRAARGNWIAFQDSDDAWRPDKLERQMACLKKYGGKICFTRCESDKGQLLPDIEDVASTLLEADVRRVENLAAMELVCEARCHPLFQTAVVDRQLLEKGGLFDESLFTAEDTRLVFNLSFLSGFLYIDRPLVVYYQNSPGSLTYEWKPESAKKRFGSYLRVQSEIYWRLMEMDPQKAAYTRERLGYFISRRAGIACAASQYRAARAFAKDAVFFAGDFRTFLRSAAIFAFPMLLRPWFRKKWFDHLDENSSGQKTFSNPEKKSRGLFTRKWRRGLSWRGWLFFILIFGLAGWLCVLNVQPFLAGTRRADAKILVVEGWIHEFAIRAAVNEFKSGAYEKIYTTGGPVVGEGGYSNDFNTSASVGADLLKKNGVAGESLQMVPSHISGRDRTYSSAVALRDWFGARHISVRSLNVLTEDCHARRTQLLFQKAFGPGVTVGVISVPDPDYDAKHWWRYSEGVREVLGESIAWIYAKLFFHPAR